MLKEIKIGDRLVLFGKLYRILIKHRGLILMIEMNVDKMIFKWEHETVLSAFLNRDEAVIDTSEEIRYPIERLTDDEKAVMVSLKDGAKHIDVICRDTHKKIHELMPLISSLEIKGILAKTGVNVYGLTRTGSEE